MIEQHHWGARELEVDFSENGLIKECSDGQVYRGRLGGMEIACKFGHVYEMRILEPLLRANKDIGGLEVPLPAGTADQPIEEHYGIMHLAKENAQDYLDRLEGNNEPNLQSEQDRLDKVIHSSVEKLRQKGIMHPDASLSNTLIYSDGSTKTCDFGRAYLNHDSKYIPPGQHVKPVDISANEEIRPNLFSNEEIGTVYEV